MYERYLILVYLVTMCMAGILYQFTWLQCVWTVFNISLPGYNVYGRYFISVYLVTMCMNGILY